MSQIYRYKYNEDSSLLINFLAEKIKTETLPFDIEALYEDFKEIVNPHPGWNWMPCFKGRILEISWDMPSILKDFDSDTKVKIMFGVGASVDSAYLEELKKEADVELDERKHIIKYEKKDGSGLKLEGDQYLGHEPYSKLTEQFLNYLNFKVRNMPSPTPINEIEFLKEFRDRYRYSDLLSSWKYRYQLFKVGIIRASELDREWRFKMLFVTGTEIDENLLEVLREHATVELDKKKRITKYEANDGKLMLRGGHTPADQLKIEEEEKMKKSRADNKTVSTSTNGSASKTKKSGKNAQKTVPAIPKVSAPNKTVSKDKNANAGKSIVDQRKRKTVDSTSCTSSSTSKRAKLTRSMGKSDEATKDSSKVENGKKRAAKNSSIKN